MNLFYKLKDSLGGKEDPVVVEDLTEIDRVFQERRQNKLEEVERKSQDFHAEITGAIGNLDNELEDLQGFEDSKDRQIVNDVVSNIVDDRRDLINKFSAPERPRKLYSELDDFLDKFSSMTEKEAAVMEEAYLKDRFSDNLGDLKNLKKRLGKFLEDEHATRERYHEIKQKLEQRQKLEEELDSLEEEIGELELHDLEEKIELKKKELEELKESKLEEEYNDLELELEELEQEKERTERRIGKAMVKMERGLKKMLYEGEIGKISSEESEVLREIREEEKQELKERNVEEVEKAVESVRKSVNGNFLNEKTREKLLEGVEILEDFSKLNQDIKRKEEKIEQIEQKKEAHEFNQRKSELENQVQKLERELGDVKHKSEELEDRKEDLRQEVESIEEEIMHLMESEFDQVTSNS